MEKNEGITDLTSPEAELLRMDRENDDALDLDTAESSSDPLLKSVDFFTGLIYNYVTVVERGS